MALSKDSLWASGHDETVEVNQRALIDKVLARYSGEFTVFRELLQNADDASSNEVEIHFETRRHLDRQRAKELVTDNSANEAQVNSLSELRTAMIHQWTFKNDGLVFRDEDWNRLKKIAEGNPDEDKIGAFGVGFYALFSITEEPFVSSGNQWMGFYWKDGGDQLFVRRGSLPQETDDRSLRKWTSFTLPLRTPAPLPPLFDLARFLASSLTFMSHLRCVSIRVDEHILVRVRKDIPGSPLGPAASGKNSIDGSSDTGKEVQVKGLRTSSPQGLMAVKSVRRTTLYIEAEVARCVYALHAPPKTKPKPLVTTQFKAPAVSSGFFSSLFSSFVAPSPPPTHGSSSAAHQRSVTPTPAPPPKPVEKDPAELLNSSIVLTIFTAVAGVKMDAKLRGELQRATKKNPPSTVSVALIYTGKAEYDASKQDDDNEGSTAGSIFQGLRADIDGAGTTRVFIGHATGQTTGIGGHVAARFIPTVERESVDLVDRNVSIWNKELLFVTGFLARAAYNEELASIRELWNAASEASSAPAGSGSGRGNQVDDQVQKWLTDRCLHSLQFFTFRPSTPSSVVSNLIESGFFACGPPAQLPFYIMSTRGPASAADVRLPDPTFAGFLTDLPVLPADIVDNAKGMVDALKTREVLREITFVDVLKELAARPLGNDELIACLKWWIGVWNASVGSRDLVMVRKQLVEATLLMTAEKGEEKVIQLSAIRTFVNLKTMGSIFPLDGPMPLHTLPLVVSRQFQANDLSSALGWSELGVVDWLRHIIQTSSTSSTGGNSKTDPEFDLATSPHYAERILTSLSKAWPSLAKPSHAEVVALLENITCVPTRAGLRKPGDAYFPNAHVFHDLPVVVLPSTNANTKVGSAPVPVRGNMEKVLEALGVRKHVDLQVVFDRMIKTGDWTTADLVKYLVAVQQTLTPVEFQRLQATSAFPKEVPPPPQEVTSTGDTNSTEYENEKKARYKAGDLYEPLDVFRSLHLPILDWGSQTKWRTSSEEAKFLYSLGLRRQPPLLALLRLASGSDAALRSTALKYLLDNRSRYLEYSPDDFSQLAFVPAVKPDGETAMGKPSEVFVDSEYAALGFWIVDQSIKDVAVEKLGIKRQPPTPLLISLLEKSPPKTEVLARQWFEVLAGRVVDFSSAQLTRLSHMVFVPAQVESIAAVSEKKDVKTPSSLRMMAPKDCYFKRESDQSFHSKLFVFVDFGAKANGFLSACGTKHEPSVEEIVEILLSDPKRFYRLCEGKDSYLVELRNIAVNRRLLSNSVISRMKKAPILLGTRRVRKSKALSEKPGKVTDPALELDEDEWDVEYDLLRPDAVVVADDTNAYHFFGDAVFTAPQEDVLEGLYLVLGSSKLTSLIREDYRTSAEIKDAKTSKEMRSLILERLPLFLHEHTNNRTKVQYGWLNNEKNFVVRTFGKLTVTKNLNFGATRLQRNQDASAAAKRNSYGPLELWLAGNAQVDMYEVAISLCRLLFDSPKANDALLFMTILSTDLRALKRRGYNVDRILKQQRAEREAAEQKRREQANEMEKLLSDSQPSFAPAGQVPVIPQSVSHPVPDDKRLSSLSSGRARSPDLPPAPDVSAMGADSSEKRSSRPTSSLINSLQGLKRKFGPGKNELPAPPEAGPSRPDSIAERSTSPPLPPHPASPTLPGAFDMRNDLRRLQGRSPRPQNTHVTPLSNIESNIKQAIAACREEHGGLIRNRDEMQVVKESLEEGYCDVSGRTGDMSYVGAMSDVKIYAHQDVPNARNLVTDRHDPIARFIHVIQPLRKLYNLPPTSVHIFYDLQGDAIAFNRNASIFVNLRYYEAWHDEGVKNGELSRALISWFFTLAHEIAHNLVQAHNSEHEFYFSSICEAHVSLLGRLIASY